VAKNLGISQAAYSSIESGKTKVSESKLLLVASILDVELEVIKNFSEQMIFNSCAQSGYIHNQNINPVDKIEELYEKLLAQKDIQIDTLKEQLKSKV
jgi:transcriptional regulator with XRE-family HTH domain